MRQLRKLTNKEWEEIGEKYKDGGVHMYRGKRTYFYNGEILWNEEDEEWLVYNEEERQTWQVMIVLPGVEVIPPGTFIGCKNVETVIMSDSVRRIERNAFVRCKRLKFVKLSTNLEYIGDCVFWYCKSLTSIFIPESCREIDDLAFYGCRKLLIFNVPQRTELANNVISNTALTKTSPFETVNNEVKEWIQNLNQDNEFALHRECASIEPSENNIYEIIKQQGLSSFQKKNAIGITPLQYLQVNPYANIDQQKLVNRFILEMMGETETVL